MKWTVDLRFGPTAERDPDHSSECNAANSRFLVVLTAVWVQSGLVLAMDRACSQTMASVGEA